ncbi:MAG: hypothetical protein WCC10_12750, partial [Tumebacillaceae bacterium]
IKTLSSARAWCFFDPLLVRNKAVKKTLTIPQWLNDIAEENKINFSQILQDALKQTLGIKQ